MRFNSYVMDLKAGASPKVISLPYELEKKQSDPADPYSTDTHVYHRNGRKIYEI